MYFVLMILTSKLVVDAFGCQLAHGTRHLQIYREPVVTDTFNVAALGSF